MSVKEEIRSPISTIWRSLTFVETCFNASYAINDTENSASSLSFFKLAGWSFWRIRIIEFAKLLSSKDNDKFRVEDLLKKLSPNQYWGGN